MGTGSHVKTPPRKLKERGPLGNFLDQASPPDLAFNGMTADQRSLLQQHLLQTEQQQQQQVQQVQQLLSQQHHAAQALLSNDLSSQLLDRKINTLKEKIMMSPSQELDRSVLQMKASSPGNAGG